MNNLYNNITDKNNFYSKLTTPSALLMPLLYLLSVTLIPVANSIINTKNNTYVSAAKQYNMLLNKGLATKTNSAAFNTINTATYINNGQMLARQIDNNNLQNYVNDAKGSVLKLNSADKSQNQTYSYNAYGAPIANIKITKFSTPPLSAMPNSFQYNGERYDNNTALQYLRARFYNPETKRFLNQDSYDLLNRFGYVNANPVMGIDPSGHIIKFTDFAGSDFVNFSMEKKQILVNNYIKNCKSTKTRIDFSDARLKGINLERADLSRANLSRADLSDANLSRADISRANLSGANFSRADLSDANLSGANLSKANLSRTVFFGTDLTGADLTWTNLSKVDLSKTTLSRANFAWTDLSKANLSGTDLSGVNFFRANLSEANLEQTNLAGANLEEANILEGIVDHSTNISQMPFRSQVLYDLFARVEAKRSQLTLKLLVAKFIVKNKIPYC